MFGMKEKIEEKKDLLGKTLKDTVSGFIGVAVSEHNYLNGCTRYTLQPKIDKDGKLPDVATFDFPQLEVVEEKEKLVGDRTTGGPEKYSDKRNC